MLGWSVLSCQLSIHNRHPIQARIRPERDGRHLHANSHSRREHMQFRMPQVRSLLSTGLAASLFTTSLAILGVKWIDRYQELWRFCCRQEPGQIAEFGRVGEVALPVHHRKPSGDASTHLAITSHALSVYLRMISVRPLE